MDNLKCVLAAPLVLSSVGLYLLSQHQENPTRQPTADDVSTIQKAYAVAALPFMFTGRFATFAIGASVSNYFVSKYVYNYLKDNSEHRKSFQHSCLIIVAALGVRIGVLTGLGTALVSHAVVGLATTIPIMGSKPPKVKEILMVPFVGAAIGAAGMALVGWASVPWAMIVGGLTNFYLQRNSVQNSEDHEK